MRQGKNIRRSTNIYVYVSAQGRKKRRNSEGSGEEANATAGLVWCHSMAPRLAPSPQPWKVQSAEFNE